jgi:hypothetical protein
MENKVAGYTLDPHFGCKTICTQTLVVMMRRTHLAAYMLYTIGAENFQTLPQRIWREKTHERLLTTTAVVAEAKLTGLMVLRKYLLRLPEKGLREVDSALQSNTTVDIRQFQGTTTVDICQLPLAIGSEHTLQQPAFAKGYLNKVDKALTSEYGWWQ